MKNQFLALITGIFFIALPIANYAQIKVIESEKSDSTQYLMGTHQDSVYIVYKAENNKSTITLTASLNGIDSLNFDWFLYDADSKTFNPFRSTDSVSVDTIKKDDPALNMNDFEGAYRVNIHNQQKGIDTTFTIWLWYQDFFINSIRIVTSTCTNLELEADTSFQDKFVYYDLSDPEKLPLSILNGAELKWTPDPGKETDIKYGAKPRFKAPVEETSYMLEATDSYGFTLERTYILDENKEFKNYPALRAVKAEFSGIHGNLEGDNPSSDSVSVEAPYGVMFYDSSKNAEKFEWIFYNHIDWMTSDADTVLGIEDTFEPIDSIFYLHPKRSKNSPDGYDVKLIVWGIEYNDNGDRCLDSIRKENFVLVDTTQFPAYYTSLPNVFSPSSTTNNYFYFVKKPEDKDKPVKSIQYFSIKIYTRWGDKIYEYEDDDGSWHKAGNAKPGWDGITRVGTRAKAGVYYYAILAKGWDGREFEVGGFVHIFY